MRITWLALSGLLAAIPAQAATVVVTVTGIQTGKGAVSVGICDTGLGGDNCPVGAKQDSMAATLDFVFENVPPGNYAFGAHQDINQNGERDENFLGIPKEPVALSNHALDKLIPTFVDAQVPVFENADNRVQIQLQMYGAKKTGAVNTQ